MLDALLSLIYWTVTGFTVLAVGSALLQLLGILGRELWSMLGTCAEYLEYWRRR